jgi:hypothetical protein
MKGENMKAIKIKQTGSWFPFFWLGAIGVTFNQYVFVKKSYWEKASQEKKEQFMVHENVHSFQQVTSEFT